MLVMPQCQRTDVGSLRTNLEPNIIRLKAKNWFIKVSIGGWIENENYLDSFSSFVKLRNIFVDITGLNAFHCVNVWFKSLISATLVDSIKI